MNKIELIKEIGMLARDVTDDAEKICKAEKFHCKCNGSEEWAVDFFEKIAKIQKLREDISIC